MVLGRRLIDSKSQIPEEEQEITITITKFTKRMIEMERVVELHRIRLENLCSLLVELCGFNTALIKNGYCFISHSCLCQGLNVCIAGRFPCIFRELFSLGNSSELLVHAYIISEFRTLETIVDYCQERLDSCQSSVERDEVNMNQLAHSGSTPEAVHEQIVLLKVGLQCMLQINKS